MNQFVAPKLTRINKIVLILAIGMFLMGAISNAVGAIKLPALLGLSGIGISKGFIFQLITYPFVETSFMGILFNSLIVWFIGCELEKQWGEKIYLRFMLLLILGVGIIYSAVTILFLNGTSFYNSPLFGLSGLNLAYLIAYATLFPDRQMAFMMLFPMKAKTFCWILVAIETYTALVSSANTAWAHLLAMALGFLVIRYQNRPFLKSFFQKSWKTSALKRKKHLHIVKDEENKPPKYWQ